MYRIARIRMSGIGPTDARYDRPGPDAPPFEINCLDAEDNPADTLVWLENGGGKTVLLSLVFHVLRPDRAPTIGGDDQQRRGVIDDYLLAGDVGHVVCEWVAEHRAERLITAMVAEKRGSAVNRTWYLLVVKDQGFSLDDLVFDADGRRIRSGPYLESVETLSRESGSGRHRTVELFKSQTQRAWLALLADHDLDPALFEYQTRMNRSEGGATSLFKFSSVPQFLEFFLELTMNPASVAQLSETLARVADKVADLPRKEADLAYCRAATEHLAALAEAWDDYQEAARDAATAMREAGLLDDGLAATIAGLDERIADGAAEEERLAAAALDADRARRDADDMARFTTIAVADAEVFAGRERFEEARRESEEAALQVAAWVYVPTHHRLAGLRGEHAELSEQIGEAAAPIRDRRDRALRGLRAHLVANRTKALFDVGLAETALETAVVAEAVAARRARLAVAEKGEATGRKNALEGTVEAFNRAMLQARSDGIVADIERATQALDRWVSVIVEREAAVVAADDVLGAATERTNAAREHSDETVAAASTAEQKAREAAQKALAGRTARDHLACHALVGELAGEGADLELVGSELAQRAHELGRRRRAEAVTVEAAAAEDRRASRSLTDHNLLPPRREAEMLCDQLRAAGVASAFPGWRYLADAVPVALHDAVIAAHPALVDGVVVADADLGRAVDILSSASPAAAVVIGVGTLLVSPGPPVEGICVVPPDRAMFDASAAPAAAEVRSERLGSVDATLAELADEERIAFSFAAALTDHLEAWPQGVLASVEGAAEARRAEAAKRRAEATAAQHKHSEAAAAARAGQAVLDEVRRRLSVDQRTHDRVERLAADEAGAEETGRQIEALRRTILEADEKVRVAEAAVEGARTEQEQARGHLAAAKEASTSATRDLGSLPDPGAGPAAEGGATELRARYETADQELTHATSSSDKAIRLRFVETELSSVDQSLTALDQGLRSAIAALAELPAAADNAARAEAEAVARHQDNRLRNERVAAESRLRLAENRRAALPAPERPVVFDLPNALDELRRAAEDATAASEAARAGRSQAEEALAHAKELSSKTFLYRGTVQSHRTALSTAVGRRTPQPAAPFTGDVETAVQEAANKVTATAERSRASEAKWRRAAHDLVVWARHDRWGSLTGELPRRLAREEAEVLANDARALVLQVRLRAERLSDDITKLDTYRQLLLESLGDAVRSAHASLRRARTKSTLPEGLGAWSHQPFLKLNVDLPSDAAELQGRLRRFANDLIEQSKAGLPTGATLVCRSLLACTEREVRVEVLKPNKAQRLQYVPITDMATLSGGMRATAAIAMFCTLARVRAANHGGRVGVGTLILDNPIGDANATYLVTLQRLVAHTSEVQLIYTTGVNDMDAIRLFPVLNRLSNETARRSNLAYVVADPTFLKQLAPVDGDAALITGTRLVRRHPAQLTFDAVAAAAVAHDDL